MFNPNKVQDNTTTVMRYQRPPLVHFALEVSQLFRVSLLMLFFGVCFCLFVCFGSKDSKAEWIRKTSFAFKSTAENRCREFRDVISSRKALGFQSRVCPLWSLKECRHTFLKWLGMFNTEALLNAQGQRGNAILLTHIRSPARLGKIPIYHLVHLNEEVIVFVPCTESHLDDGSWIKIFLKKTRKLRNDL